LASQKIKTKSTNNAGHPLCDCRLLADLAGERWKALPGFDQVEISNYGRVKSLARLVKRPPKDYWAREKILKRSSTRKSFYDRTSPNYQRLVVQVALGKIDRCIYIKRWVYFLFVEQFDLEDRRLAFITSDGDPANSHVFNIECSTKSIKASKSYANGRPREAFNKLPKPVWQLDLNGKVIARFASINEAASLLKIGSNGISGVCHNQRPSYKGYRWRFVPAGSTKNKAGK
jgi:hypothetical protein